MEERRAQAQAKCDGYAAKFPAPLISGDGILAKQREAVVQVPGAAGRAVVLVDVRSAPEVAVSMVEGAVTQEEFEALEPTLDKGTTTVVPYCTIGYRSGAYAKELVDGKGWPQENVFNGEGVVLFSYTAIKFVAADAAPTTHVHVYGAPWDLAHTGYDTVTFGVWGALKSATLALRDAARRLFAPSA